MRNNLKIIALILIFSIFAVASSSAEKEIVGKWYNEKGDVVDVRNDGTFDDPGYGTGTWKLSDDGSTYEFIDFYGESQKVKIESDENGEYIRIKYYGKFYRDSYQSQGETDIAEANSEVAQESLYEIYEANDFSDGTAWIKYQDENKTSYFALIDTTGNMLYNQSFDNGTVKLYAIDNGIGYFTYGDEYSLINSNGKIVASSSGGGFDSILAYGNGVALVYKNESNVNESKHLYAVINSSGKFVVEYNDWGIEPDEITHIGDGLFIRKMQSKHFMIYNSNTNQKFYVYFDGGISKLKYINGKIYIGKPDSGFADFYNCYVYKEYPFTGNFERLSSCFSIDMLGNIQKMDDFVYETDGILVCYPENGDGNYTITDTTTNQTFEITKYKSSQIANVNRKTHYSEIKFNGDYGVIYIYGKDGKQYFSLINRKGEFQFEPIVCYNASGLTNGGANYSDGIVVYQTEDNLFNIINEKGEIVAEGLNYKEIGRFDNDIALAREYNGIYDGYPCYINKSGEKIVIKFKN